MNSFLEPGNSFDLTSLSSNGRLASILAINK